MNDFDRFLESELKLLLGPLVALRPPVRGGRSKHPDVLVILPAQAELAAEAVPVVEPAMTLPVAGVRPV